jgi:hypothetical protein
VALVAVVAIVADVAFVSNTLTCCPYLHRMINTGRSEQLSIRGPCHRHHIADVAAISEDVISCDSIPHLHHLIVASSSEIPAVG